jgi:hypothetical protein
LDELFHSKIKPWRFAKTKTQIQVDWEASLENRRVVVEKAI